MTFRVMTYNILDGGISRENYILDVIHAVDPDLIAIQEVTDVNTLRFLGQALQMQYFIGMGNKERKVALLSRLPVMDFKSHHPIFPIWHNFIEAQIQYQPGKTFRMFGVHLIANLWVGFELWRLLEMDYIIKYTQQFTNELFLIAGDFNTAAPHDKVIIDRMPNKLKSILRLQGNRVFRFSIHSLLSSGFIDCFRSINPSEDGFTLPPPQPNTRLDYIFINPAIQKYLTKCWVVREPDAVIKASDHYPVVAEFSMDSHKLEKS